MSTGRIIVILLGIASLIVAVVYAINPEAIGGPVQPGEMTPQAGMPGDTKSFQFTTIPILGTGQTVTVPVTSPIAIFGILGVAFLVAGLVPKERGQAT